MDQHDVVQIHLTSLIHPSKEGGFLETSHESFLQDVLEKRTQPIRLINDQPTLGRSLITST
jgi:hypothetical protein